MQEHVPVARVNVVSVTLDHSKMRATAVLSEPEPAFSPEMVATALAAAGVVHGIHEDRFSDVGAQPGFPVVVAEGSPAAQGRSGWVECLVQPSQSSTAKEGDNTRLVFQVLNVRQGEPVAFVHEPEVGADGITVTGESIPGRRGAPVGVSAGPGVAADPQCEGRYCATRDGDAIVDAKGKIDVRDTIEIGGNLDITKGDITFVGSLIVRGDIRGDLVIKVGKNLTVLGDVDDAVIEAGGDVTIKNGFMGRGSGKITAGGTVKIQHLRNQHVTAGNEVHVERESVNGIISAKRKIMATRAVIAGGVLEADELVEVGTLGRSEGGQVKVRVGRRGRILERLAAIEKELRQTEKNLTDVKDAVYRLVRLKIDTGSLPAEKEAMLTRLQETQRKIPHVRETLLQEQAALTEEVRRVSDAKLVIHETVSDNVFIDVNGVKKMTDTEIRGVVFVERNGELTATGL